MYLYGLKSCNQLFYCLFIRLIFMRNHSWRYTCVSKEKRSYFARMECCQVIDWLNIQWPLLQELEHGQKLTQVELVTKRVQWVGLWGRYFTYRLRLLLLKLFNFLFLLISCHLSKVVFQILFTLWVFIRIKHGVTDVVKQVLTRLVLNGWVSHVESRVVLNSVKF